MEVPKKIGKIKLKNPASATLATAPVASGSGSGSSYKNGVKVEDFAEVSKANGKGKGKSNESTKIKAERRAMNTPGKDQEVIVVSDSDDSVMSGRQKSLGHTPISIEDDDDGDEFDEVAIPPTTPHSVASGFTSQANTPRYGTDTAEDEDDDMEEVQVDTGNEHYDTTDSEEEPKKPEEKGIQIVIGGLNEEEKERRRVLEARKKPITARDRAIRLEAHKMHVIALLANARIRNKWCTDQLLQCRLLSLCPNLLHQAFKIPPSQVPDKAKRSRMFFEALQGLATWWSQSFFEVSDWQLGVRTRTWDEVMAIVDTLPRVAALKAKGGDVDAENAELVKKLGDGGERLRTVKSLMKKALQQEGGRDTSAQLFVALCRALGLGARLVVSLQAVPWRAEKVSTPAKGKNSARGKGKGKEPETPVTNTGDDEEEDDFEEVVVPPAGEPVTPVRGIKRRADGNVTESVGTASGASTPAQKPIPNPPPRQPLYRLRKPKPQKLGKAKPAKKKTTDLSDQPPVFWAEVFCRSDQKWITVDPVKGTIRKKKDFEPKGDSGPVRMLYVVAFEEDGYAKDVTLRYTRTFGAKTAKLRVPVKKDGEDWWENVMGFLKRPYRLNRDDLEDAELETSQVSEGMPMGMTGFKDHPLYVLERHLKREEVILPKREVGRFKGEPVYRRQNVLSCRTAENWMRIGRQVRPGQEPLKWVKQRAVTLNKRRAQELAAQEGEEPLQQGLYSEAQTQLYTPPPIVDGKIPKNAFGNLDLYVPTMLPPGSIHLPYKGIAKVAKQLKLDYAEACTGFEFKKQRAIPVITGIVVAKGQEDALLDAYWESAAAAEERALTKKQEKAMMRWRRLINGMRVQARLQAEYGDGGGHM